MFTQSVYSQRLPSAGRSWLRAAVLAWLSISQVAAAAGERAVFTAAQAARGEVVYAEKCRVCHGSQLTNGTAPPLSSVAFLERWADRRINALLGRISRTMPPGASDSISVNDRAAVVAYILSKLGHAPGDQPLIAGSPEAIQGLIRPGEGVAATPVEPPDFIAGTASQPSAGAGPNQEELNSAKRSTKDWLYHTHDYSGSRYVALDQINTENVGQMRAACVFQVGELSNFQAGPIVYAGRMYVTALHSTVAIDATTCRPLWRYEWAPRASDVWRMNRGVAIKEGRVIRGTSDGYLLSLNAETGELLWARRVAKGSIGETLTMAPMIFEDLVLIGPAGSENGISGWVGAFRLSDGSPVWRFKTVPGAGEPDSESWRNPKGIHLGGGAVWTPFSLDVERAELYVAVTNPAPDLPAHLRPGNNLYTNSLVALDVRTGELRWYKQLVPSDSHDWDFTQVSPLFDLTIGDQNHSLVAATGKDGLLRALDRQSHETLYETAITTRENADTPVTTTPTRACPGVLGGVEWNGPAYNPRTRMLYTPVVDWCSTFRADDEVEHVVGALYMGGGVQMDASSRGWITAVDAASGQVRWRYESDEPMVAAVTTTAGGLVFGGELTGDFVTLDASSGAVLNRFQTGGPIGGGIVSYEVAGKQYVAVTSGRPSRFWQGKNPGSPTVLVFSLP